LAFVCWLCEQDMAHSPQGEIC